jgi:hypothetical protein
LLAAQSIVPHSTQTPNSIGLRVITEKGSFSILFLRLGNATNGSYGSLISDATQKADTFYASVLRAIRAVSPNQSPTTIGSHPKLQSLVNTRAVPKSVASEIEELWQLKEKGAISMDEYERAKRSLL